VEPVRVKMRRCGGCGRLLPRTCFDGGFRCRDCGRLRIFLAREPLVEELTAWRRENLARSWVTLGQRAGVPERSIRRIVSGESRHVRLDMADKLAMALDQPLSLLYPWE
jgi:hypothetical protein